MEEKQYDLLLSLADNRGEASVVDLVDMGMTTDNTAFYDKETYLNSEAIQKRFTDLEGNFNQKAFDTFYNYAASQYSQMGALEDLKKAESLLPTDPENPNNLKDTWKEITEQNAINLATYDADNFTVSARSRKNKQQFLWRTLNNPRLYTLSLTSGLNEVEESKWSDRELAQMHRVFDSETGEWLDKPSFWSLDLRPLVLATYDEDVKDENGQIIHKKGEEKLDEYGQMYYETLGNRSVYGKQLLNRFDVMTEDTSWLNNIDFFDSDDKYEKNPVGSVLKTAALVGSMWIPGVGPYIAGASVLLNVSSMLGTIGKMIMGQESSWLNNLEAFAKQYSRESHTDEASQNTFAPENIIGLMGEVAAQLKEQRWIVEEPIKLLGTEARLGAKYMTSKDGAEVIKEATEKVFLKNFATETNLGIKKLLEKGNVAEMGKYLQATEAAQKITVKKFLEDQVKKNMKISSPLSKAYMTFLTTQDAYGEAIALGIPKEEAVAYTLMYTALEAAILNTGIGERILPELHADRTMMKGMLRTIFQDAKQSLEETKALRPNELLGKKKLFTIMDKVKTSGNKVLRSVMPSNLEGLETSGTINFAKVLWGNAIGEMVEETSEELLADFSKEALTLYRKYKKEEEIDMWKDDNWVDRYLMSALGGFLGGGMNTALTHAVGGFLAIKKFGTFEGTANDAILAIAQDPEQEALMDKVLDKLPVGSSIHSFEFDDFSKTYKTTNNYKESLDYAIKQSLKHLIKYTSAQLKSDGAYASTDSFLNCMTEPNKKLFIEQVNLQNLKNTKTLDFHFKHFRVLLNKLMNINSDLETLYKYKEDGTERKDTEKKLTEPEKLKEKLYLEEKLKVLSEISQYLKKEKIYDFAETAIFEANESLNKAFRNKNFLTEGHYAEYRFNKKYNDLNDLEKSIASEEYNNLKNEEDPEFIFACYNVFKNILADSQEDLKNTRSSMNSDISEFEKLLHLFNLINNEKVTDDNILDYANSINDNLTKDFKFISDYNRVAKSTSDQNISTFLGEVCQNAFGINLETIGSLDELDEMSGDSINGLGAKLFILDLVNLILTKDPDINFDFDEDDLGTFSAKGAFISNNLPITKEELLNFYCKEFSGSDNIKEFKDKIFLKKIDDINNLLNFSPALYAYITSMLDQINTNDSSKNQIIKETLSNLQKKSKEVSFNILKKLLDKKTENDAMQDILNLLDKLHKFLLEDLILNFDKLRLSAEEKKTLNSLLDYIKLTLSILEASRIDNADILQETGDNLKGYAPLLNNINKLLNLNKTDLVTLDKEQVNAITLDMQSFLNLIENYIKIDDINSSQKLKEETSKRVKDIVGTIQFLEDNLNDTDLGNSSKLQELCPTLYALKESSKNPSFDKTKDYNIKIEDLKKLVKEKTALEEYLYNILNSSKYKDNNGNINKAAWNGIIQKCLPEASDSKKNPVISDTKDKFKFLVYLLRTTALKSSLFYNSYKEYLLTNPNLAAIYEQEINVHTIISYIANHYYIDQVDELINEHCCGLNKSHPSMKMFYGLVRSCLTEGFPGAGKTTACVTLVLQLLSKANPSLIQKAYFAHTNLENATKVTEKLKEQGISNIEPKSKEELLTLFYPNYNSYVTDGDLNSVNSPISVNNGNVTFKDSVKPVLLNNCPKLIFIDECSKYNDIDMRLLEEAAKVNGFLCINFGDYEQIKKEGEFKDPNSTTTYYLLSTPYQMFGTEKISLVIRAENSAMQNALEQFSSFEGFLLDFKGFTYYEDDLTFAGVKSYKYSNENLKAEVLSICSKMMPEDNLLIICQDLDEVNTWQAEFSGNPKISVKTIEDSQGNEASYIIDTLRDPNFITDTYLYTSFSRAKKGAILANPKINPIKVIEFRKETLSDSFILKTNAQIISLYDSLDSKETLKESDFYKIKKINSEERELSPVEPPEDKDKKEEEEEDEFFTEDEKESSEELLFDTKEEAENYLNGLGYNSDEFTWEDRTDKNHTIVTKPENWEIIDNGENKFKIVVSYPDTSEQVDKLGLKEFETKYNRVFTDPYLNDELDWGIFYDGPQPSVDPVKNEPSDPTVISKTTNTSKVNTLLYSFNTLPVFDSNIDYSQTKRIDNYFGLLKLLPGTKINKSTSLPILLLIQSLALDPQLSLQDKTKFISQVIINNTPKSINPDNFKLVYGITHHYSGMADSALNRDEPDVEFLTYTNIHEYPGTNVTVNLVEDGESILEVNLASVPSILTLFKLNWSDPTYLLIITKCMASYNISTFDDLVKLHALIAKEGIPFYQELKTLHDYYGSLHTTNPNLGYDISQKICALVYALFKIYGNNPDIKINPTTGKINHDFGFYPIEHFLTSPIPSLRNANYVLELTGLAFSPRVLNVGQFISNSSIENLGVIVDDIVYIANEDIKLYNRTIPAGSHFILYSNDISLKKFDIKEFIDGKTKDVQCYLIKPMIANSSSLFFLQLHKVLSGEVPDNYFGHSANSFFMLKALMDLEHKDLDSKYQSLGIDFKNLYNTLLQNTLDNFNISGSNVSPEERIKAFKVFFERFVHGRKSLLEGDKKIPQALIRELRNGASRSNILSLESSSVPLYKIFNLWLHNFIYDKEGNINAEVVKYIDFAIKNGDLPKIYLQTKRIAISGESKISKSSLNLNNYEMKGVPERFTYNSFDFTDELISLIDWNQEKLYSFDSSDYNKHKIFNYNSSTPKTDTSKVKEFATVTDFLKALDFIKLSDEDLNKIASFYLPTAFLNKDTGNLELPIDITDDIKSQIIQDISEVCGTNSYLFYNANHKYVLLDTKNPIKNVNLHEGKTIVETDYGIITIALVGDQIEQCNIPFVNSSNIGMHPVEFHKDFTASENIRINKLLNSIKNLNLLDYFDGTDDSKITFTIKGETITLNVKKGFKDAKYLKEKKIAIYSLDENGFKENISKLLLYMLTDDPDQRIAKFLYLILKSNPTINIFNTEGTENVDDDPDEPGNPRIYKKALTVKNEISDIYDTRDKLIKKIDDSIDLNDPNIRVIDRSENCISIKII